MAGARYPREQCDAGSEQPERYLRTLAGTSQRRDLGDSGEGPAIARLPAIAGDHHIFDTPAKAGRAAASTCVRKTPSPVLFPVAKVRARANAPRAIRRATPRMQCSIPYVQRHLLIRAADGESGVNEARAANDGADAVG